MPRIANATTEPEIEITEAMIDAGELAFSEYDPRFEGPKEAVKAIFLAMVKIAKEQGVL